MSEHPRCPARKEWVRDHTCKKALGHHGMHECECGEHWLNEDDWTPCPSQGWAVLGMVKPAAVRCGLQLDHPGPHRFAIEWESTGEHSHSAFVRCPFCSYILPPGSKVGR